MDFRQKKSSSSAVMNTSDASANTNMTKDKHYPGPRGVSTIACTFEAKDKEKIKIEMISTSKTETAHNKIKSLHKEGSSHTAISGNTIEDAENSKRSYSNATAIINDEHDDELIFQLDDNLNHLSDNDLLIEKRTSDIDLFDDSFEVFSAEKLSASLFEKRPSDDKCLRLSSDDEANCGNESTIWKSAFGKSNTPRSSTPKRIPIGRRSTVNISDASQEGVRKNIDHKRIRKLRINGELESLKPSTLDVDIQREDSHVDRISDPMPSLLDDDPCIHCQEDDDVNETVSLLSSDAYDESDNDDGPFSKSHDLSPSNYLLTVDDLNCLKRSCATASTCSIQSDFGNECSKEIADIMDNESLSLDSSYSESEDDREPENDENVNVGGNNTDIIINLVRGKKIPDPQMMNDRRKSSRTSTGTSDKSRLYIPPAVSTSYAPNVTWPSLAATPTTNSHRSNRKRGVRANTTQNHHDLMKQHEARHLTRKLFDPYAERRLSATLPSQPKRYNWNFDPPKKGREKTSKEDWPALLEHRPPSKSSKDSKQRSKQPTYAQVLNKPKPKHQQKCLRKLAKETVAFYKSVTPIEDNALSPKGDEDTGPPCRGELLVSNSITTFSLNKDGSTSVGVHQATGPMSSTNNEKDKEKHQTRFQKSVDFKDPAIVAISANYQVSSHGNDSDPSRPTKVKNSTCNKADLLRLLFRPAVQLEDPAIVGVHHAVAGVHHAVAGVHHAVAGVQHAVAAIPSERLESNIPTQAHLANAPFCTPKKQVDIDDPAIIYAHRNNACPTQPPSSLIPQPAQTGFWSVQENISNRNSFVTSNPLMNQHALTSYTYSTPCQNNFVAECPGYMQAYYPLNACMLAAVPSTGTSGVVCNC